MVADKGGGQRWHEWSTTNDHCPARGVGLLHTWNGDTHRCRECQVWLVLVAEEAPPANLQAFDAWLARFRETTSGSALTEAAAAAELANANAREQWTNYGPTGSPNDKGRGALSVRQRIRLEYQFFCWLRGWTD